MGILVASLATGIGFTVNSNATDANAIEETKAEYVDETIAVEINPIENLSENNEEIVEETTEEAKTEVQLINYDSLFDTKTTAIPIPEGSYFQDIGYETRILARAVRKEIDNSRSDEILANIYKNYNEKTMEELRNFGDKNLKEMAIALGLPKDGKFIFQDNGDGTNETWYSVSYKEKDDIVFYNLMNLIDFYYDCELERITRGK